MLNVVCWVLPLCCPLFIPVANVLSSFAPSGNLTQKCSPGSLRNTWGPREQRLQRISYFPLTGVVRYPPSA
eukprot:4903157-Prorocentrum_lima.AAC.1